MKRLQPGPGFDGRHLLAIAFAAFGFGILLTFFLSPPIIILIESFVIIAVAVLCLSER